MPVLAEEKLVHQSTRVDLNAVDSSYSVSMEDLDKELMTVLAEEKLVHQSTSVDPNEVEKLHSLSMEALDKELMPVLAEVMELNKHYEGMDDHPSVQWLFKWFSLPERTADEFYYVVGSLLDKITHYARGEAIYVLRAAAEALAVRCPVLDGRWDDVAWVIAGDLGEWKNKSYGQGSSRLSNWIIRVVGDPKLCPSPCLRLRMLLMYRTIVKFDSHNRTKALEAMMFTFASLDRKGQVDLIDIKTDDIIDYMIKAVIRNTYQNPEAYAPSIRIVKNSLNITKSCMKKYSISKREMPLGTIAEDIRANNITLIANYHKPHGDLPNLNALLVSQMAEKENYIDISIKYNLEETT